MKHKIKQVVTEDFYVKITLENGVCLDISSNNKYLHLSFSGIKFPGTECGLVGGLKINQVGNYLDIEYLPYKEDNT